MSEVVNYDPLIASLVVHPHFVPRDWLTGEVMKGLADRSKSFVLLTAESGAGKTGLSAALAHAHPDWLRYFIRRDSRTPLSSGDAVSFLFSVGHQLAMRKPRLFHPDKLEVVVTSHIKETRPGSRTVNLKVDDLYVSPFYRTAIAVDSEVGIAGGDLEALVVKRMVAEKRFLEVDNLQYLALLDPASLLEEEDPSASIVILIDALDEVQHQPDQRSLLDWLASCPMLPPNLRFVLTSRDDPDLRLFRAAKANVIHELTIDPERKEVRDDLERYLEVFTSDPLVIGALSRHDVGRRAFIKGARVRARGNFGYLSTLARGILEAEGRGDSDVVKTLLRLEGVPEQLSNLYAFFLDLLRHRITRLGQLEVSHPTDAGNVSVSAWEGVAQRVLGVLSVAREALTSDQIARFGAIRAWPRDLGNVLGQMLEFLNAEDGQYRLFTPSFAEYLATPPTGRTAPNYFFDPLEWHTRIGRSYKGDAEEWSDVDWAQVDNYGLVHLAEHLALGDVRMRREVVQLVEPGARRAMLNRFLTDSAFLHVVSIASSVAVTSEAPASALPQLVYLSSVKALLSEAGDQMTPPVLALMARLGRTATALGYIDTMNPTVARYHGLKAIRANASPADLARAGELTSLERLEAFAFELPETSYRYAFQGQRMETLLDFAQLLAATSLDRALQLASRITLPDYQAPARDRVLRAAAIAKDNPADALSLIQMIGTAKAEAALDCTERLLPVVGEECRPLLEQAELAMDLAALPGKTAPEAARLVRAWAMIDKPHAAKLWASLLPALMSAASGDKPLRDAKGSGGRARRRRGAKPARRGLRRRKDEDGERSLLLFTSTARTLWNFDPKAVRSILKTAFAGKPDRGESYAYLEASRVLAENGDHDAARKLINRVLAVRRGLAPDAAASDLFHAARSLWHSDPAAARSLIVEAFKLLDEEEEPVAERNDSTYEALALHLSDHDLVTALKAARRIKALGWTPHPGELYGSDRTSVLVRLAMDHVPTDRAFASALLDECLAVVNRTDAVEGVDRPSYASIDLDADNLKGLPFFTRTLQLTYYMNALQHGMERRRWRVWDRPIDLLYDLLAPPQLNGAPYFIDRVLRRFVEAAAPETPDVAEGLCEAIRNDYERAIGYAALFDGLAQKNWERARPFAETALATAEAMNAGAAKDLTGQFELLRWTNSQVRNLMEIAMHLGRYYPPSMQGIMARVDSESMTFYVSCEMIARTVQAESDAGAQSGTPRDQITSFHLDAMRLLTAPTDTTPAWIMAASVLRTLAHYDLELARAEVARFPVDVLGALLRIRASSGVSEDRAQARAWLHEAVESLIADTTSPHRACVLGRAAAGLAQLDAGRAREWATDALSTAREITDPLVKGYTFLDLLRQSALHPLLGTAALIDEVEACLRNAESPDTQAELAMHAFPVLLDVAPQRGLEYFSRIASGHWTTLLALLDHGAEAIVRRCGPAALPDITAAIRAALTYVHNPILSEVSAQGPLGSAVSEPRVPVPLQ